MSGWLLDGWHDPRVPAPGRMYDYLIGGNANFAADRQAADDLVTAVPHARRAARANREFLGRVVRHLLDRGIRQFLDIGSGLSTIGAVHQLTADARPPARIVYVDLDPIAVANNILTLYDNPNATATRCDMRFPDHLLSDSAVRDLLDFDRPVGILMMGVLPFVADSDAYPAVAKLRATLAPGSYLALSHPVPTAAGRAYGDAVARVYGRTTTPDVFFRNPAQVMMFMDGLDLLPAGLTPVAVWRAAASGGASLRGDCCVLGAVGRKL
ncbi:SAM-dependent methyltransferase [Actinoplanes sp. HUAS TT8]|uniref:SAM-dependent methyltransferase n=1 Tax=Actinoplanes sp. HUAS TT8 TaxID=3447453 RepID=UPI003F51D980